jgi:putative transposase
MHLLGCLQYQERRLDDDTYVAIYIDGKALMGRTMIHAVGVTAQGYKRSLGLTEGSTENSRVISVMLRDMIKRGLSYEDGILFCIDGGTGLHKAVEETFGMYAVIQRCEFHKHRNIESHLAEEHKLQWRSKLKELFAIANYQRAEARAKELITELAQISLPASRSLQEGLDELFTLQRLQIKEQVGRIFSTTNAIESINSVIARQTRIITRWTTNDQRLRWAAIILVQHEEKLNRVHIYHKLSMLQVALKNEIQQRIFNLHK